jgi:uncharacterized protein
MVVLQGRKMLRPCSGNGGTFLGIKALRQFLTTLESKPLIPPQATVEPGFHCVAKPVGPSCNLNCDYCFYLEKQALFSGKNVLRMPDDVLSAFIKNYIHSQPSPLVEFVWQGGEPVLAGLKFFHKIIKFQKKYARHKTIQNSLQTNGTLLTDEWCRFLKENNFLVGISLDGPEKIHDLYRRDRKGAGSFAQVMKGLRLLQKREVNYNVMAGVARETAKHPLEVYRFFKKAQVNFIQFTPIVERLPDTAGAALGLRLAGPPSPGQPLEQTDVTPWTVLPEDYGEFLIAIYEEWVRRDVGQIFVMNFEWALNAWLGLSSPVCIHADQCGRSVVVEHNGDVYACDHSVYPQYHLGNVITVSFSDMISKSLSTGFGILKEKELPRPCRACDALKACRGGCPKQRFLTNALGEERIPYLCAGYRMFFLHIRKYLQVFAALLQNNLSPSHIMEAVKGPLVIKRG